MVVHEKMKKSLKSKICDMNTHMVPMDIQYLFSGDSSCELEYSCLFLFEEEVEVLPLLNGTGLPPVELGVTFALREADCR